MRRAGKTPEQQAWRLGQMWQCSQRRELPDFHGKQEVSGLRFKPARLRRPVAGKIQPTPRCHLDRSGISLTPLSGRNPAGYRRQPSTACCNLCISAAADIPPTDKNKSADTAHVHRHEHINTRPMLRIGQQQAQKTTCCPEAAVNQLRHIASEPFKSAV